MRRLAPHGISEDALHSLWILCMERMPISVRCVISTSEGVELTKLAVIADRILHHSMQSHIMTSNNPRSEPHNSSQQPGDDFLEERLANVQKQLSELATTVKSVMSIQTSLKTFVNISERRARSRTRSTTLPERNRTSSSLANFQGRILGKEIHFLRQRSS
jgi:hypothetical protein